MRFAFLLCFLALGAASLSANLGAQEAEAFDAVAIKRVPPQPLYPRIDTDPGYLTARAASLRFLILQSFDLENYQLSETPEWMNKELYSVNAISGKPVSRPEMMARLRNLLAARFHLAFHRETRDLSVYALVVDKGGSKLRPLGDGEDSLAFRQAKPIGNRRSRYVASSIPELVGYLNARKGLAAVGLPVVDQTGREGRYAIRLAFEESYNPETKIGRFEIDYLSEFPRQLGLRLKPTKAPVNMLIVDGAERPALDQ